MQGYFNNDDTAMPHSTRMDDKQVTWVSWTPKEGWFWWVEPKKWLSLLQVKHLPDDVETTIGSIASSKNMWSASRSPWRRTAWYAGRH